MIKYLGSKRRLVPVLSRILVNSGAKSALDLFTGTTRVAQAFKRGGAGVTAVDTARYSEVFGRCYLEIDADRVDRPALVGAVERLNTLEGHSGYFTETFAVESRFFQPHNAQRVDAIRDLLEDEYAGSWMYPVLLTSLILAADRVDSTTGVQMAYVKQWAPRSYKRLELRLPDLIPGSGTVLRGDAVELAPIAGHFDLAYLDPPYNQHRYFTNYHIWETLVAWDKPDHYGVACKRVDSRDDATKSVFNRKREMPMALAEVVKSVDATVVVLSYNDESWVSLEDLIELMSVRGEVAVLAFDSRRYVGAQIGVHNPDGRKVGTVSHLHNQELVLIAGAGRDVRRTIDGLDEHLIRQHG